MTGSAENPPGTGDDAAPEQPVPGAISPTAAPRQNGSDEESARAVSPAKPTRPWPVLTLLGGFALGLPVNALSDAYPGAFLSAVAVVLLLVVSAAYRLRQLPTQARIHTLIPRITLPLAAVATVGSLFLAGSAASWAVLLAAALGVTGCLGPAVSEVFDQLGNVALIALGVATIGFGVSPLLGSQVSAGVAALVVGVALVAGGLGFLLGSPEFGGAAAIVVGVAFVGGGLSFLPGSQMLLGAAMIVFGVAVVSGGVSFLLDSRLLFGAGLAVSGVAFASGGVSFLLGAQVLLGVMTIAVGVTLVGGGVSFLLGSRVFFGVSLVGIGVATIGLGVSFFLASWVLAGVAVLAGGVALIGAGAVFAGSAAKSWYRSLLAAPSDDPITGSEQELGGRRRAANPGSGGSSADRAGRES